MNNLRKKINFLIFVALASIIISALLLKFNSNTKKSNYRLNLSEKLKPIIISRHEWTLNTDILQYSSIIFVDKNQDFIIEVLSLLNYENEEDIYRNNISCCLLNINRNEVKTIEPFEIIKISLMNKDGTNVALWKFKCKISNNSNVNNIYYSDYKIALINTDHFSNENSTKIPKYLIKYQQPTIYSENIEKKQGIANCVHLVRGLKSNRLDRLLNWLQLQFQTGMKQITFYFFEPNEEAKRIIRELYSHDQVVIIDYQTKKSQVCKYEKNLNLNSSLNRNLYDMCEKSFNKHFTMNRGYTSNAHERLNTNDCYMHYKYEYEYVTNFDFDDFIFPRYYNTRYVPLNESNFCDKNKSIANYSIYEYAKRMFLKHGSKASCLLFEHVLFVPINKKFLDSLLTYKPKNKNEIFVLNEKSGRNMFFNVTSNDTEYLRYLTKAYQTYMCLNLSNNLFSMEWNNPFAVIYNKRAGKSIFHTNNTEGIMQHFTSNSVPGTRVINVPIMDGYTGHFRESISTFFHEHFQTIKHFFIDIEYYKFLSSF